MLHRTRTRRPHVEGTIRRTCLCLSTLAAGQATAGKTRLSSPAEVVAGSKRANVIHAEESSVSKPTVVMVHGAFAESGQELDSVIALQCTRIHLCGGMPRPREEDADLRASARNSRSMDPWIVLVGHSYGGTVITVAGTGQSKVKALVYVSGLAPDAGETASALVGKFARGGTFPRSSRRRTRSVCKGPSTFMQECNITCSSAATSPDSERRADGLTLPIAVFSAALWDEPAGAPAWKTIPSWFLYGSLDKNIPPAPTNTRSWWRSAGGSEEDIHEVQGILFARRDDLAP